MRILRRSIPFILLLAALPGSAQEKATTDTQADGFEGMVRSVSTDVEAMPVNWRQPGGPTLVFPLLCRDCEYDSNGARIKSGQSLPNGTFLGEQIKITRDGQGNVVERTRVDAQNNSVLQQETLGPFGPVERTFFVNGKPQRQSLLYDRLGHQTELLAFDSEGDQVERDLTRTNADGQWTERAVWTGNGHLQYRETYNPETDTQLVQSYDDAGAIRSAVTFSHKNVASYWAAAEDPNGFGSSMTANLGNGYVDAFKCHKGGACDVFHVHYLYADAAQHYPASAEWRDASGNLLYAAWYEYEFDAQHNWTRRVVSVQSPEIPDRTLLETDTRTIAYWPKE